MFRYNANQLPTSFIKYFTSIQSIHTYLTRLSKQQNYFLRYRLQQSQKLISYTGAKLWSEIPENIKKFSHKNFSKKLKNHLAQWFPTAGPHKFFASPQSILFSAKIILIWNHKHCKDVTLCKTHFTPG